MASVVVIKDALHTPGVVGADEARLSQAAGWARSATGVGARAGVVYAGVTNLLAGTSTTAPSMTITVAPLHFVSQKVAAEGCYVGSSPGVVTLDIAAAPGANSRIDAVYVMQRDAGSPTSPDALTQGEIGVVTGTAAVSPAQPQIPVGSDLIGLVTVGAGATATTNGSVTVATTCRWTAPLGAPVPVRNLAERNALTQYDGLLALQLDRNVLHQSDGSSWWPHGSGAARGLFQSGTKGPSGNLNNTTIGEWTTAQYTFTPPRDGWATVSLAIEAQLMTSGYAEAFIDPRLNGQSIDVVAYGLMFESPPRYVTTLQSAQQVLLREGVAVTFGLWVSCFNAAGSWRINNVNWRVSQT